MHTLYKDDKTCLAANDQVEILIKAGWSREKVDAKKEGKGQTLRKVKPSKTEE